MKLAADLETKFNDQITMEFSASIVYRQLSIEVDAQDLPGMAAWLHAQADEELVHAHKFIDHLVDRGNHPTIGTIAAPGVEKCANPQQVFELAIAHEQKVSAAIRDLYRAADESGDLDSRPLLLWFLDEQIEEEATVGVILGQIKMIGDDGPGLLRLDKELGTRQAGAN